VGEIRAIPSDFMITVSDPASTRWGFFGVRGIFTGYTHRETALAQRNSHTPLTPHITMAAPEPGAHGARSLRLLLRACLLHTRRKLRRWPRVSSLI
jgi:hypothetical protein